MTPAPKERLTSPVIVRTSVRRRSSRPAVVTRISGWKAAGPTAAARESTEP